MFVELVLQRSRVRIWGSLARAVLCTAFLDCPLIVANDFLRKQRLVSHPSSQS